MGSNGVRAIVPGENTAAPVKSVVMQMVCVVNAMHACCRLRKPSECKTVAEGWWGVGEGRGHTMYIQTFLIYDY